MNKIIVGYFTLTEEEKKSIGTEYNEVEVDVRYELGGYGGFDWTKRPRSYQLAVTPLARSAGSRQYVLMGGYGAGGYVTLEETARKSQKRMEALSASVNLTALKTAFIARDTVGMKQSVAIL